MKLSEMIRFGGGVYGHNVSGDIVEAALYTSPAA
jgi:hypothetical protein